ncbi:MAG: hypothetical protein GXO23_03165 [Crenarchaeota archaeon]|nr:hypothetical protein [Thermoproteota archaeon]
MSSIEMLEEILRGMSNMNMTLQELGKSIQELKEQVQNLQEEVKKLSSQVTAERGRDRTVEVVVFLRSLSTSISRLETSLIAHREFLTSIRDSIANLMNNLSTYAADIKDVKTLLTVYLKDVEEKVESALSELSRYREDMLMLLEDIKLELRKLRETFDSLKDVLMKLVTRENV